ncbi:MAG: AraC family transcriptional regulator [Lachnospiraceae bacterium]
MELFVVYPDMADAAAGISWRRILLFLKSLYAGSINYIRETSAISLTDMAHQRRIEWKEKTMPTRYDNIELAFQMEGYTFRALNIVFEQFRRVIPRHSHSAGSYELHYIPYGHGEVMLQGAKHELSENSLYVTGPHIEHEQFTDEKNPMAEFCIYLRIEKDKSDRTRYPEHIVKIFLDHPLWIGSDTANIHPLMQRLFAELEERRTGWLTEAESLLKQIVICMVRNYEVCGVMTRQRVSSRQNVGIEDRRDENWNAGSRGIGTGNSVPSGSSGAAGSPQVSLFDSKSIILDECFLYEYNTLTLDILANRLALSRRQTERLIRQQYGKTFRQKMNEARMSAATVLLCPRESGLSVSNTDHRIERMDMEEQACTECGSTGKDRQIDHHKHAASGTGKPVADKSIGEIAELLGYSSAEHFTNAFRNYWKMSPSAYRAEHSSP